jgi:hypothetical protein
MSLFRNEGRREHSRSSTADIAASGEPRSTRPMADGRAEARPMAESRAEGAARAEARRDEQQRHAEARRAGADGRAAFSDTEVEDAVEVKREEDAMREPPRSSAARNSPSASPNMDAGERLAALFTPDVAQDFRSRWDAAQIGFVDDPRRAVQQADELVAEVMKSLAQSFADERRQLEAQMTSESASTENLRVALQRYRSFFQRLLSL